MKKEKRECVVKGLRCMVSFSHYGSPRASGGKTEYEGSFLFSEGDPEHKESLERLISDLKSYFAAEIKEYPDLLEPNYRNDEGKKFLKLTKKGYRLAREENFTKLKEVLPAEVEPPFKFGDYNQRGDVQLRLTTNSPDGQFPPVPIKRVNKVGGFDDLRVVYGNDGEKLDAELRYGEVSVTVRALFTPIKGSPDKFTIGLFPELIILLRKSDRAEKLKETIAMKNEIECIEAFIGMRSGDVQDFLKEKTGLKYEDRKLYYYLAYAYYYLAAFGEYWAQTAGHLSKISEDQKVELLGDAKKKVRALAEFSSESLEEGIFDFLGDNKLVGLEFTSPDTKPAPGAEEDADDDMPF